MVTAVASEGALAAEELGAALLQAALLGNHTFDKYFTDEEKRPHRIAELAVEVNGERVPGGYMQVRRSPPACGPRVCNNGRNRLLWGGVQALCEGTMLARDLVNERADVAHPGYLQDQAEKVAQQHGMKVGLPARLLASVSAENQGMLLWMTNSATALWAWRHWKPKA